ncbi:HopJ type III effector protein [Labilibacter marinus]|uniref:HopJ type III effector protein n=1 Tax=Labilibacter marinus TaxID=1477105 RepID=UPI00082E07F1|nr:HopJ type III effector protein [Labilibacter marinus]
MNLITFKEKLSNQPTEIEFTDTMAVIDENYEFTPTAFVNGDTNNKANENNGSCKLFAFAQLQNLSTEQTLHCFGKYYTKDVLKNPEGNDHQNIRNFIQYGWEGIKFEGNALKSKN